MSCKQPAPSLHPQYKELTEAVYASGNVISRNEYKVVSTVEGYLSKKLIQEGDTVKRGQPLFVIESSAQNIRSQTAKEIYTMAKNNYSEDAPVLSELRNQLTSSYNRLRNDSINYVRFKNLLENNATTQLEFDKAKLSFENSKNDYLVQKNRHDKTRNQLYIDLQNAENQLAITQKDASDCVIKSQIDGLVYESGKEVGEMVRRTDALALIGDQHDTYLKLSVDEQDIALIQVGQELIVKMDVFRDRTFKAKVKKIYPKLSIQDQSFRVDAEFVDKPAYGYTGLTAEANIIIRHLPKALTVPKALVIGSDS
ncbi:MAG: efflux RND transporter periplasmic adaptor subunit, partial [Cytophagales bacterium]|nr:efflux RND transporter periplasmic adaptor subunit [Cytophagales bacterium]